MMILLSRTHTEDYKLDTRLKKGDRVKLRGREPEGVIETMGSDNHWVCVHWDNNKKGPKYVHEFELQTWHERFQEYLKKANKEAARRIDEDIMDELNRGLQSGYAA
jgi:hypothetical protein